MAEPAGWTPLHLSPQSLQGPREKNQPKTQNQCREQQSWTCLGGRTASRAGKPLTNKWHQAPLSHWPN